MALDFSLPALFDVRGKVALVTGGGTGIGKMFTSALMQNGAKVYIASRKLKNVEETARELRQAFPEGGEVIPLQTDLVTKAQAFALADEIKRRESKLHILVNNAGVSWGAPLEDFPEAEGWDRLMALNIKSIFYLTTALLPLLEKQSTSYDPGRVINISSVMGSSPLATGAVAAAGNGTYSYNTSKAAVDHLTRVLAAAVAHRKVVVNAVAPGYFPSNMTAYGIKVAKDAMERTQPMGRIGTPEDMAGMALFLCSRASAHITGAVIPIDGGAMLVARSMSRL